MRRAAAPGRRPTPARAGSRSLRGRAPERTPACPGRRRAHREARGPAPGPGRDCRRFRSTPRWPVPATRPGRCRAAGPRRRQPADRAGPPVRYPRPRTCAAGARRPGRPLPPVPAGREDQDARSPQLPRDVGEQNRGGLVGPLQVIEHQRQPVAVGRFGQPAPDVGEQREPLGAAGIGVIGRAGRLASPNTRNQRSGWVPSTALP